MRLFETIAARRRARMLRDEGAVLQAIRDGARYGLDIGREARLRPGRLYPTLGRLESDALIVGRFRPQPNGKPDRRAYYLAGDGEGA